MAVVKMFEAPGVHYLKIFSV